MKKRHSAEQIVGYLRQADVLLGKGQKVPEVCKQLGISDEVRRDGASDGPSAAGAAEGERSAQASGGRPGVG